MRGVVSLAAALALPSDFPGRNPIFAITFGVILVGILGQATTLAPLARRLGIIEDEQSPTTECLTVPGGDYHDWISFDRVSDTDRLLSKGLFKSGPLRGMRVKNRTVRFRPDPDVPADLQMFP